MWKFSVSASDVVAGTTRWGVFWRGLVTALIGILIALKPWLATFTMSVLFGWGLVFSGGWIAAGAWQPDRKRWGWFIYGLVLALGGILLLSCPQAELLAFAWSVAILLLTSGVIGIGRCLAAHDSSMPNILCFISSICSILLGLLLTLFPMTGLSEMFWMLGILLAAEGILLLIVSFRIADSPKGT